MNKVNHSAVLPLSLPIAQADFLLQRTFYKLYSICDYIKYLNEVETTPPGLMFEIVVTTSGSIFGLRSAHYQPAVRSFHERTTEPNPAISSP